jgi:ABC-type uncharacterized transport system auxiliary subunit
MRAGRKNVVAVLFTWLVLVGTLLTANCGATRPIKYYTLNSAPAPSIAVNDDTPLRFTILVGRISASPLYIEHPIVYTAGGVELQTYEYHRWAEIPTEMLENMLMQSLRSEGKFRSVTRLGGGAKGDYILRGHLYSLEEVDAPSLRARFSVELELFQPKTRTVVWSQSYSHDEPVSQKSVLAVVEALRQNVLTGLDQLSASLASYLSSVSSR